MSNAPTPTTTPKPQDPCRVLTPEFRASFCHVWTPREQNPDSNGQPRPPSYQMSMLFPKTMDMTVLRNAANEALKRKFGPSGPFPKGVTSPFKDGDQKEYDGYVGHIYLEASTKSKPGLVDLSCQPILDSDAIYSGCYCRATVTASYYEVLSPDKRSVMKRGIKFYLNNVQKMRDGQPFQSARTAQDDFAGAPGTTPPPAGSAGADFSRTVQTAPAHHPAPQASAAQPQAAATPPGDYEPPF